MQKELPEGIQKAIENIEKHIIKNFARFTPEIMMSIIHTTARHSYNSAYNEIFGTWEEVE